MNIHAEKTQGNQRTSVAGRFHEQQNKRKSMYQFIDARPETVAQRILLGIVNSSPQVKRTGVIQKKINNKPMVLVLQRYIPQSLHGADNEEVYARRFANNDFNPHGANRGLIRIGVPAGHQRENHPNFANGVITLHGVSVFGVRHAEEDLINQAAALEVNFDAAPNDATALRVISLYTERSPCTGDATDAARQQRNTGDCTSYLQNRLHQGVPVSSSVPNSNAAFNALMYRQDVRSRKARARTEVNRFTAETIRTVLGAWREAHDNHPPPDDILVPWRLGLFQIRDQQGVLIAGIAAGNPDNSHAVFQQIEAAEDTAISALNQYPPLA